MTKPPDAAHKELASLQLVSRGIEDQPLDQFGGSPTCHEWDPQS